MKQEVDKLIVNLLLDEGEVYLPNVGTLILRREPSKLLSNRLLQRPYRELRLTKEERGGNIVFHIARVAGISQERASDIYTEYCAQSLRDGIFTIESLCTIENMTLRTHQQFEDMANPKGRGVVKVNPRTNYFIYVMAGLCMGFALGVAGYVLYTNGTLDRLLVGQGVPSAQEAFEGVAEKGAESAEATVVAPQTEVVEMVETPAVEEVITSVEPMNLPMQRGKSYAVWGVYNERKNAEDAVAWLATRVPEVGPANIYDYDGRYMVALCEVASRSECGRKVSAWKAEHKSFKSVWVYTR